MTNDNTPDGLFDLYRRPLAAPLATLVATAILLAFAYQGHVLAQRAGLLGYALVGVAAAAAYAVAKCAWELEDQFVREAQGPYRFGASSVDRDATDVDNGDTAR